jgi:hypothetical protein
MGIAPQISDGLKLRIEESVVIDVLISVDLSPLTQRVGDRCCTPLL